MPALAYIKLCCSRTTPLRCPDLSPPVYPLIPAFPTASIHHIAPATYASVRHHEPLTTSSHGEQTLSAGTSCIVTPCRPFIPTISTDSCHIYTDIRQSHSVSCPNPLVSFPIFQQRSPFAGRPRRLVDPFARIINLNVPFLLSVGFPLLLHLLSSTTSRTRTHRKLVPSQATFQRTLVEAQIVSRISIWAAAIVMAVAPARFVADPRPRSIQSHR